MTATNAAKTRSLDPGQSVTLSETASGKVWAERSGNGETLRFVRSPAQTGGWDWRRNPSSFEVFRTEKF